MSIPYIGYGNKSLERLGDTYPGDVIDCHMCGAKHEVQDSVPGGFVQFFVCGDKTYIAGLGNKRIINRKPDVSGSI